MSFTTSVMSNIFDTLQKIIMVGQIKLGIAVVAPFCAEPKRS